MEHKSTTMVLTGTDRVAVGRSSVQRVAHEGCLPQQANEWLGEPTTNEGATATESEPKRAVVVGGRRPAAKQSAANRCEHHLKVMSERSEEVGRPARGLRKQTQAKRWRRHLAAQPAQRLAALCAGGPEDEFYPSAGGACDERQTQMGIQGVQPCKSSEIHDSGSAAGRLDGAYFCAQDASFSASEVVTRF